MKANRPSPAAPAAASAARPPETPADADTVEHELFDPVVLRARHDGWSPDRQMAFIQALAETGCVDRAAKAVGMSRNAAYKLRNRPGAHAFREAWNSATEMAMAQLSDSALSRAIHGTVQPVFYHGEKIGERRIFNEQLTMFMLRMREPARYGRWIDRIESAEEIADSVAITFNRRQNRLLDWLYGATAMPEPPLPWDAEDEAAAPPAVKSADPPAPARPDADDCERPAAPPAEAPGSGPGEVAPARAEPRILRL